MKTIFENIMWLFKSIVLAPLNQQNLALQTPLKIVASISLKGNQITWSRFWKASLLIIIQGTLRPDAWIIFNLLSDRCEKFPSQSYLHYRKSNSDERELDLF